MMQHVAHARAAFLGGRGDFDPQAASTASLSLVHSERVARDWLDCASGRQSAQSKRVVIGAEQARA